MGLCYINQSGERWRSGGENAVIGVFTPVHAK